MAEWKKGFSRRQVLGMAVGVGGLVLCGDAASALAQTPADRVFTPSVILGIGWRN